MAAFTVQNLTNFVTTFTLPYLMNPGYANLGAKVGFIYGSFAYVACIWAFFYYPELKGRSLEEIDLMFEERILARHTPSKHFQLSCVAGWKAPYQDIVAEKLHTDGLEPKTRAADHVEGL
ncbi:hypothetical protein ACHAPY_010713 [Fusarium culmorum]